MTAYRRVQESTGEYICIFIQPFIIWALSGSENVHTSPALPPAKGLPLLMEEGYGFEAEPDWMFKEENNPVDVRDSNQDILVFHPVAWSLNWEIYECCLGIFVGASDIYIYIYIYIYVCVCVCVCVLVWLWQLMDSWSHTLESPCHLCKHSKRFVRNFVRHSSRTEMLTMRDFEVMWDKP